MMAEISDISPKRKWHFKDRLSPKIGLVVFTVDRSSLRNRKQMGSLGSGPLKILELMQLADSAFPIGATAHSLGLETLVEDGLLSVDTLVPFFRSYIDEMFVF